MSSATSIRISKRRPDDILDKVKDDMTYLAVLMPVAGHSEEGDDIWGCPAVHTDVDAS